jgi:FkbM family methyltransferase
VKARGYALARPLHRRVRRALRFAVHFAYVPDRSWVKQLLAAGARPGSARLTGRGRELRVQGFALPLLPSESFVLFALDSVQLLQTEIRSVFVRDSAGRLRCRIGAHEYYVSTEEELRILVEIHVLGTYNFLLDGPYVVCDIGMNVGFASLYFAARPGTLVYGFEPLRDTYEAALRNFDLNPGLSASITSANVGLAATSRTETVLFSHERKGVAGNQHTTSFYQERGEKFEPRRVALRAVTEVLDDILRQHPDRALVLKIDCEGAEYEIIEALHRHGSLRRASVMMIEWHARGPDPLATHLREAGFTMFSFTPYDRRAGMLYASRSGISRS